MDNNLPQSSTPVSQVAPLPPVDESGNKSGIKVIFIIILALAILGAAATYALNRNEDSTTENNEQTKNTEKQAVFKAVSNHTVVYGEWTGENSVIKAFDLQSGSNVTLATLPMSVKKLTIISASSAVYINKTDIGDQGKELIQYSLANSSGKSIYTASEGFGIEEYVISPNKEYIAVWEIALNPTTTKLLGGKSRVYAIKIGSTTKNLLYDEPATAPVHYPRAITNTGGVFSDKFLPETTAGWAYGMSFADFTGAIKEDLAVMQNGTYGTKPSLSPDGTMLLFAGYDGTAGPGTEVIDGGIRKAILAPNTIEVLDTTTRLRRKLANLPNTNSYSPEWDKYSDNIIFTQIGNTINDMGLFSYDLQANTAKKVETGRTDTASFSYITQLSSTKNLIGILEDSPTSLGNLGGSYQKPYTKLAVLNTQTKAIEPLDISKGLMQLVDITPSAYFEGSGNASANEAPSISPKDNLQLETFDFVPKPSLAPVKEKQQNLPNCREYRKEQCSAQGIPEDSKEFKACIQTLRDQGFESDKSTVCYMSPLYIYGPENKKVLVKIHTGIYNSKAQYNDGYDVTLLPENMLEIGGNKFESISYDYTPGIKRTPAPKKGVIVAANKSSDVLTSYAKKLGLNAKETKDLIQYGKENITSPYVYLSFFDQEASKRILPISFTPEPDTYINYVFYFKLLSGKPSFTPVPPTFPEIPQRGEFTAVEISGIVE